MQSYTFLLAAIVASAADLPTCACHADALDFTIDCKKASDTAGIVTTSYEYCKTNCLTDCSSAACKKNFAIVESHHDFCLHDQVPKTVEVGFHDLEDVCPRECVVGRLKDPKHAACPSYTCPKYAFQVEEVIKKLADEGCATACPEAKCGEAFRELRLIHDTCAPVYTKAHEWAGIFAVPEASHTWSMQKVGNPLAYADPSMKLALIPTVVPATEAAGVAKIEELENKGSNLLISTSCTAVADKASMKPDAAGSCFELKVGTGDDSTFTIDTTGIEGLAVFAQHVPLEFERDKHYLYDANNVDIEPTAQENIGAFEWAGIFPMAAASHTWSMQKVDGKYADATMNLALIPTDAATKAKMEALENKGSNLLAGTTCTVVNDGETMKPDAAGSCFTLTTASAKDDSTFTIDSTGLTALAVFAQHVPIEFERDKHYLYDSANVDIEPAAEESAGPGGHDHGHRRLADVDAALHTYEDSCDAVGCFVEVGGCAAGTPDLTALTTLKDRAGKKCHVTEEEGTTCPTSAASDSGVKPVEFLAGVALLLTVIMQ
jgi:hypothetical protein